jgi:hypothetical protein
MRYNRTYEHQCDFDEKNRAQKASQDYYNKWINLRKEVRNLVREQNLIITPEFSKLIGLK